MPAFDWILFGIFVSALSLFFAVRTKRSRQKIFILQCVVGAIVGVYGFWAALTKSGPSFFAILGFPLSAIIVVSLSFAALTLETVFSFSLLKTRVFPILSLYFVGWIGLNIITFWKTTGSLSPLPVWHFLFFGILTTAFVLAVVSKFSLACFQILLPLIFLSFLITLAESHQVMAVISAIDSVKSSVEDGASRFRDAFLKGGIWTLFFMFGYLYLNTRVNKTHLKQNAFADQLPKASVVLVLSSFLYQFPELASLRKLLPIELAVLEYVHLFADLLVIPLFLLSSGWPYIRTTLSLTFTVFGVFSCAVAVLSASIANPLSRDADSTALEKGRRIFAEVTSWNPEKAAKAVGYSMNPNVEKSYSSFGEDLGTLKQTRNVTGQVYTYLTPFYGLTSSALVSADAVFEMGTAKLYLRMVKDRSPDWDVRAVELHDNKGYYFRFFQSVKAEIPEGGYRMVPLP